MNPSAVSLRGLGKSFRVPRVAAAAGALPDPRRRSGRRGDWLDVLSDVNFDVPRGQTLGVVGANGSGKSTLLKILAGVMTPSAGHCAVEGKVGALLEVGAGFHPDLSGEENIHLSGAMLGMSRRQTEDLLPSIIQFSELERFMDMPVRHYSSGMIVRLGFAVAIQLRPDVLLLDETFTVGDARFQNRALNRIRQMKAAGTTILLVSHNAELLLELADRLVLLDRGRVAMDGAPHPVLAAYQHRYGAFQLEGRGAEARLRVMDRAEPAARGPIRLTDGKFLCGRPAKDGEPDSPPTFESADALEIEAGLEWDEGASPEGLVLAAWFMRDDGRAVARAEATLPPPGPGARRLAVRLRLDPLRLMKGIYAATLTLARAESEDALDRRAVEGGFRVVSPLPYDFLPFEFRLVAEVEHRWT